MHKPVLLKEILEFLEGKELSTFIDGTVGAGGHSHAILTAHPEIKKYLGFDQDKDALELAAVKLASFQEIMTLHHANFRKVKAQEAVDAILLDIGVSSMQLDQAERGFSFSKEGPLDMRMNPTQILTAKEIINSYSEKEIADILFQYGEIHSSRRLAKAIVLARKKQKFSTTKELSDFLTPQMGYHPKKIHPMTLVFQALRIAVNDELGALEEGLEAAFSLLAPEGRLLVISFHSLEDRIVKNFFRSKCALNKNIEKEAIILTKKPVVASEAEVAENPRARSAKIRVLQKI